MPQTKQYRFAEAFLRAKDEDGKEDLEAMVIAAEKAGYKASDRKQYFIEIYRRSGVQSILEQLKKDRALEATEDRIKTIAALALQRMIEHIKSKDKKISVRACEKILDKSIPDARKDVKLQVQKIGELTPEQIVQAYAEEMKKLGK